MEHQEKYVNEKINLHIAEYNALTTRCTYFLNFQFVLLVALIAWFTFGIYLWDKNANSTLLIWAIILGAQILELVSAWNLFETYNTIYYLEKILRPKISDLLKNKEFWEYEPWQALQRDHRLFKQRELFGLGFFLVLILGAFVYECILRASFWIDTFGFISNLILWIIIAKETLVSLKLKREFKPEKQKAYKP